MFKHYIYCQEAYNFNRGGSVGYISSLYKAFKDFNPNFTSKAGIKHHFAFANIEVNKTLKNDLLENVIDHRFTYTQNYTEAATQKLLLPRKRWFREIINEAQWNEIDKDLSSIHIHGAYNFLPIYNSLVRTGVESRVIKILTTHNPYQPTMEDMYLTCRTTKWLDCDKKMFHYYFNERDKWAFTLADCLFFPSEESLEGYYNLWDDFKNLIKNKPIYFCPTGTKSKDLVQDKEYLRKELNIPKSARIFVYLGRFIDVRGYDILIEAAKILMNSNKNVYFLVVGENARAGIESPQWIQIPYTQNPQDYIHLADACLCPNRGSLFDLSMIEILSLKKPLICSFVGGYKWLEGRTKGMIYAKPNSIESFVKAMNEFLALNEEQIKQMCEDNFNLYQKELTLESFEQNYCKTIDKIYEHFGVSKKIYQLSFCEKTRNFPLDDAPLQDDYTPSKWQRKLTKLQKNPKAFFRDFIAKKIKGKIK